MIPAALLPLLVNSAITLLSDIPALTQHWSGKGSTHKALAILQDFTGVAGDVVQHVTPDMLGAKVDDPNAPSAHEAACAVAGVDPVTMKPVLQPAASQPATAVFPPGFDYDKFAAP